MKLANYATQFCYKHALKPILFRFDPEKVHHFMVSFGSGMSSNVISRFILRSSCLIQENSPMKMIDGIQFPNPVGLSAGFDYDGDLVETLPNIGFGFHTIGTVTLGAYEGNPAPRLTRLPNSKSILVNKGLKNSGAAAIIAKLQTQRMAIPVGVSIASTNRVYEHETEQIQEITDCFRLFEESHLKHSYYELNISCPNTFGGQPFTTPLKLERLLRQMDLLQLSRPLYVKMPIDQSDKETLALLRVLNRHNVQGVIFGNLTKDKTNPDVDEADRAVWRQQKGNLSGKPTWKRSNHCIEFCRTNFGKRFTIIGSGGIFSGADAQEKLDCGADLVQLITGMIYEGPQLIAQINQHLEQSKGNTYEKR